MITTLVLSFAATVLLLLILRPWIERLGLVDVPNARSSHHTPVLRGGGLAVAIATSAALLAAGVVGSTSALALLAGPAAFAAIGFADDHRSRSVASRMFAQVALGTAATLLMAAEFDLNRTVQVLAVLAAIVWIVGFVNVFNFMDGINGISAVTASVVGIMYMSVGSELDSDLLTVGGAALVGGAVGFLPFNFPVAKFFAGDVGSYFLGSYIAVLTVIGLTLGVSIVTAAAPLMVYLFDTSVTVARRARKGARLWDAHREHSYQHLANIRLDHTKTSLLVAVVTGLCATLGVISQDRGVGVVIACAVAIVVLALGFIMLPLVLVDRRSVPRTAS